MILKYMRYSITNGYELPCIVCRYTVGVGLDVHSIILGSEYQVKNYLLFYIIHVIFRLAPPLFLCDINNSPYAIYITYTVLILSTMQYFI